MPVAVFQIAGKKFQKGKTGLMLPFTASSMYGLPFILYVPVMHERSVFKAVSDTDIRNVKTL